MSIFLLVAAIALLIVAFVSAYYMGKAELSVSQMLRQREVIWSYFGAYGLWWLRDIIEIPDYSPGYVIFRFFVFVAFGGLLVFVHDRGVRQKQKQRDK